MIEQITFQTIFQFLQTVSIMVGIAYYIMVLQIQQKNQQATLETRQAQLFMQVYGRWNDEYFIEHVIDVREANWNNFDEFKKSIIDDPSKFRSLGAVIRFYEGLGVLVKENLINIHLVALLIAGDTRMFWEKMSIIIEHWREERKYPRLASETEYLYNELMKYLNEYPELAT